MITFRASLGILTTLVLAVFISAELQASEKKKTAKGKDPKAAPAKKVAPILVKDDELNAKDPRDTQLALKKSPRKTYTVTLTQDTVFQIDLKSKDFDAIARLEDKAGKQVAFNDDAPLAKGMDARLLYRPTQTGEFTVVVTNRDGKSGKFSLSVAERPELNTASIYPSKSIPLPVPIDAKDRTVKIADSFFEQDGIVFGKHYKAYSANLQKGIAYRIDLRSGDFDAFLVLEDPNGNIIAQDDDSGEGVNARITFTPDVAGVYRIIATTATARRVGKFELSYGNP